MFKTDDWYLQRIKRLHIGVSLSYRGDITAGSGVRFRARPGIHEFSHRPASTGTLAL